LLIQIIQLIQASKQRASWFLASIYTVKSSSTFGALHFQSLQTYPNTSRRHSWPVAFDFCHLWTWGS